MGSGGTGGISTFASLTPRLKGKWWKLPAGSNFDDTVLRVWNDHDDHWSWDPIHDMPLIVYKRALANVDARFIPEGLLMKLSSKASRFVAAAMRDAAPDQVQVWRNAIDENALTPDAMRIALKAVLHAEGWRRERLDSATLDEDEKSDIINDLRFLKSIERDLSREISAG